MTKTLAFAALLAFFTIAPAVAKPINMRIVTPSVTLTCANGKLVGKRLELRCTASRTSARSRAFFQTYRYGEAIPYGILAQVSPLGNGGPSVGAGDNSVTVSGGYNVAVNQANAFNFTSAQAISGAGNCGETGTPTYGALCLGRNVGATAMVIGPNSTSPWNCTASCTAGSSGSLCLYGMPASGGVLNQCVSVDTTGVMNIGKLKITNNLNAGGNTVQGVARLQQQAVNDIWGSCVMTTTTCSVTWTYAPTFCAAQVLGSTPIASAVGISSTTITVTAASSNTATWDVTCH